MLWEHPDTKRRFIRNSDTLVELKHENADEYRSEVVHIPKYVIDELRPNTTNCRIDVLFRRTKTVKLPEDFAQWLLDKFKTVYKVNRSKDFNAMDWKELISYAKEKNVFKVGMNKKEIKEALNVAGRNC